MTQKPVIVVAGSLHYDIMLDAPHLPRRGETVAGSAWRPKFGGKGGNQAIAAARAGAEVRLVGAVGDDAFGRFLLDALAAQAIDTARVARLTHIGSGMSVAISEAGGDYGAVIVSGANLLADPAAFAEPGLWQAARALLLQSEMPDALNVAAARAARSAGALTCLNAAPSRPLPEELAALLDLVVVNAIEAEELGGGAVSDLASAAQAAQRLSQTFPIVVVTAGSHGVAGAERSKLPVALPARQVRVISTHGAGDAFVGTLVTRLAAGLPFADALQAANAAAAAHVSGG